jgi:hypothetical protein
VRCMIIDEMVDENEEGEAKDFDLALFDQED